MKRILCIIVSLLIIISLFGCKSKVPDEQETYIPATKSKGVDEKSENIDDEPVGDDEAIENADEPAGRIEGGDIATADYLSIDELKTSIKEKTYTSMSLFEHNKVGTIEYFYMPVGFEGYELCFVSVNPAFIKFYYAPIDTLHQLSDEITVNYLRPEAMPDGYTGLELYQEQQNGVVNDDGLIYEPEDNRILFAAGESSMTFYVPDSMNNYETLKPLCVAEKITIE